MTPAAGVPQEDFVRASERAGGDFARRRCHTHPEREAAARCPGCARPFCRECVSEHDDRLLCAACLRREAAAATQARPLRDYSTLTRTLGALAGLALAGLFFYAIGSALASFDNDVHATSSGRKPGARP